MNGLNFASRCSLTASEIEYSDIYNELIETGENNELLNKFNQAISILTVRRKGKEKIEDFSSEELELLGEVFCYING